MKEEMSSNDEQIKVVVFHSFKGGTGKTLISANFVDLLVQNGNSVLFIESDFTMPAFQSIFSEFKPDIFLNDFLNTNTNDLSKYIYPDVNSERGIIFCDEEYRSKDKIHTNDQNWFRSKKRQLEAAIQKLDYDYVVFDTKPGIHLFTINLLSIASDIRLLLRPDVQSVNGSNLLLETLYNRAINLSSDKTPSISLIFNQVPKIPEIDDYIDTKKNEFSFKYEFIDNIDVIHYTPSTSYYTAIQQFVLPNEDPTKIQISKVFNSIHT